MSISKSYYESYYTRLEELEKAFDDCALDLLSDLKMSAKVEEARLLNCVIKDNFKISKQLGIQIVDADIDYLLRLTIKYMSNLKNKLGVIARVLPTHSQIAKSFYLRGNIIESHTDVCEIRATQFDINESVENVAEKLVEDAYRISLSKIIGEINGIPFDENMIKSALLSENGNNVNVILTNEAGLKLLFDNFNCTLVDDKWKKATMLIGSRSIDIFCDNNVDYILLCANRPDLHYGCCFF